MIWWHGLKMQHCLLPFKFKIFPPYKLLILDSYCYSLGDVYMKSYWYTLSLHNSTLLLGHCYRKKDCKVFILMYFSQYVQCFNSVKSSFIRVISTQALLPPAWIVSLIIYLGVSNDGNYTIDLLVNTVILQKCKYWHSYTCIITCYSSIIHITIWYVIHI